MVNQLQPVRCSGLGSFAPGNRQCHRQTLRSVATLSGGEAGKTHPKVSAFEDSVEPLPGAGGGLADVSIAQRLTKEERPPGVLPLQA